MLPVLMLRNAGESVVHPFLFVPLSSARHFFYSIYFFVQREESRVKDRVISHLESELRLQSGRAQQFRDILEQNLISCTSKTAVSLFFLSKMISVYTLAAISGAVKKTADGRDPLASV